MQTSPSRKQHKTDKTSRDPCKGEPFGRRKGGEDCVGSKAGRPLSQSGFSKYMSRSRLTSGLCGKC